MAPKEYTKDELQALSLKADQAMDKVHDYATKAIGSTVRGSGSVSVGITDEDGYVIVLATLCNEMAKYA